MPTNDGHGRAKLGKATKAQGGPRSSNRAGEQQGRLERGWEGPAKSEKANEAQRRVNKRELGFEFLK